MEKMGLAPFLLQHVIRVDDASSVVLLKRDSRYTMVSIFLRTLSRTVKRSSLRYVVV